MHTLLLSLCLMTEPAATLPPDKPEVTKDEQITLLKLQVDELAAKNSALEAQIRRIDGVNRLADGWNKRGCVVESDPSTGLIKCRRDAPPDVAKPTESAKPEKPTEKK